jgi:hypothetical protein
LPPTVGVIAFNKWLDSVISGWSSFVQTRVHTHSFSFG